MNTPVLLQCTNQHHPTIYNFSIWWFQPIFQNITQIGSSPYRSGLNINNVWNHLYQVKVEFMLIFMVNVDKYTSPMDPMGQVPNADFFFLPVEVLRFQISGAQLLATTNISDLKISGASVCFLLGVHGKKLTFKDSIWHSRIQFGGSDCFWWILSISQVYYCWWFRDPKQPPGMYKNPANNGINYLSINWLAGVQPNQQ